MSLEDKAAKLEKLEKVTALFDQFMSNLTEVRINMDLQSQYSNGYSNCLSDILKALIEDRDSEIIQAIKVKVDMDSRREVLDELSEGLSGLHAAYKKILSED